MILNSGKTEERILEGGESSRSKIFTDVVPLMITFALASHFYGAVDKGAESKVGTPAVKTTYQAPNGSKPR